MSATDERDVEQDGRGSARVVIRGVQAIVLDDLPDGARRKLLEEFGAFEPQEAWIAVAKRNGQADAAIRDYAGQSGSADAKPGKYKAPPATSWFVSAIVIEPPLP